MVPFTALYNRQIFALSFFLLFTFAHLPSFLCTSDNINEVEFSQGFDSKLSPFIPDEDRDTEIFLRSENSNLEDDFDMEEERRRARSPKGGESNKSKSSKKKGKIFLHLSEG